jgi:Leu/Phe-tRNA-protein transferase
MLTFSLLSFVNFLNNNNLLSCYINLFFLFAFNNQEQYYHKNKSRTILTKQQLIYSEKTKINNIALKFKNDNKHDFVFVQWDE